MLAYNLQKTDFEWVSEYLTQEEYSMAILNRKVSADEVLVLQSDDYPTLVRWEGPELQYSYEDGNRMWINHDTLMYLRNPHEIVFGYEYPMTKIIGFMPIFTLHTHGGLVVPFWSRDLWRIANVRWSHPYSFQFSLVTELLYKRIIPNPSSFVKELLLNQGKTVEWDKIKEHHKFYNTAPAGVIIKCDEVEINPLSTLII